MYAIANRRDAKDPDSPESIVTHGRGLGFDLEHRTLTTDLFASNMTELDSLHYLHPFTDPSVLRANGGACVVTRGEGCHVFTHEGKKLLDGMAGLWCVHIGYGHPEMVRAIAEQAATLPFFNSFSGYAPDITIRLAAALAELAPPLINTFFFTSSGSEANDTIFKLARLYWNLQGKSEKRLFITRRYAYHGVSGVSTSLSGLDLMHSRWGYPLSSINLHIEGPYKFMHGRGQTDEEYGDACARALERKIAEIGADNIAAFMAEPVYGAAGVIVPPPNYWRAINQICREHGILICADEVVCGFGRTGEWFGSDLYGIEADFLTLAKGLTSGYVPMGAVGVADRIAEVVRARSGLIPHGFTYSGHPIAAAAALKSIEILKKEKLVERVRDDIGPYLQARYATLTDHPLVSEVRGVGLMAALEVVADKKTCQPFPEEARVAYIAQAMCARRGLIMRAMRDTLYCAPPFTISRPEIDFLVDTTRDALDATMQALDKPRRRESANVLSRAE